MKSPSSDSLRPLPGWGSTLRRWPFAGRTAFTLATLAGITLTGCAGSPTTVSATSTASVNSSPARLRDALGLARLHLNAVPRAASHPFNLVAFKGVELDENGVTVPTYTSSWEFTFSRYAEPLSKKYETVTVVVPGAGATRLSMSFTEDAALSPIEHWDNAIDPTSPDSPELLGRLRAQGIVAAGATVTLSQGKVRVEASGKAFTYDTTEGTYSPIQ